MIFATPFRLPLATGGSPAGLILGVAFLGFVGSSPVFLGSVLPEWVALVCGLVLAMWFFALLALPSTMRTSRASDVVLALDGITVEGGPLRGRRWAWDSMRSLQIEGGPAAQAIALSVANEVIARSDEPAEVESLDALAKALDTIARGQLAAEPNWANLSPKVALCVTCGAPLIVSKGRSVSCRYCGAVAVLSDELASLAAGNQALDASRERTSRAVKSLLRWPSASRVNAVLIAAVLPLVIGWPAAAVFASEFFQSRDVLSWREVGVVWAGTFALTLALVCWVEGQVVHRRAFALLVASFRARVLDAERWLLGCRSCGAPLGARADELVATCAYCESESLLVGLDVPVHHLEVQARTLHDLAVERVRSMRAWRGLGVVAFCAACFGVALLAGPVTRAIYDGRPSHPPVDRPWAYEPPH